MGTVFHLKEAPGCRRTGGHKIESNAISSTTTICQAQTALHRPDLIFPVVIRSNNKNNKNEHLLSYNYGPESMYKTLTFKIS